MPNKSLSLNEAEEFPLAGIFPTPLELLMFYDEDIQNGKLHIHDWQADLLQKFGKNRISLDESIDIMLTANNGAGKSQIILAPCAIWMALKFTDSLTVITTASGEQLETQGKRYIHRLGNRINIVHKDQFAGINVFECQHRHIYNNITKSHIDMFATDEPGKAEGRHRSKPDGEFAIIVDEGKSVADNIFEALDRMSDRTRRLDITSPGPTSGYYYKTWRNEKLTHVIKRKVTAFECPHIPVEHIQRTINKYGINHPFVRSSIYAEFNNSDDSAVISRELLNNNIKVCKRSVLFGKRRAGLDLAAGGDECVMDIWHGNTQIALEAWKEVDTTESRKRIIGFIESYNLQADQIWADDGGLGRGILDQLAEAGYIVNRVLNNHRPFDITHYVNRGVEAWYNFKRFIEQAQVKFLTDEMGEIDPTLYDQLTSRYNKYQDSSKKLILESKAEARAKGHPSPDRADATILAWSPIIYPAVELSGIDIASIGSDPANSKPRDEVAIFKSLEQAIYQKQIDEIINGGNTSNTKVNPNIDPRTGMYIRNNFSMRMSSIMGSNSGLNFPNKYFQSLRRKH